MRPRAPLRCVQATAATTARFRLWTEPPESDYKCALDFRARAAEFENTRSASGRVLQTVSLPDATFLREPGRPRLDAPAQLAPASGQLGSVRSARRRRGA